MKPHLLLASLAWVILQLSSPLGAEIVMDSQADFDPNGAQGTDGWSYGYRLVEPDDDRENYDPEEDFLLFNEDDGWIWDGTKWDWGDGDVPWTEVAVAAGHPNGSNNGEEHWVIRRWEANVLSEQALALTWHLHKNNTNGGNGVSGSVHVNGDRVDFASVAGNDGVGIDRTVYVNVSPGDFIDFALLPEGEDGDPADGADGSSFWISGDDTIPGDAQQPDGTPFVPAGFTDSDGDGLPDSYEEAFFPGDLTVMSAETDTDGDGLLDIAEFEGGTNPTESDSDSDGFSDGEEVAEGTDPRNPANNPGIIADSSEDWSLDGEHDPTGWSAGYRDLTADGGTDDYHPTDDFILFNEDDGWVWNGNAWDWADGNVPWTMLAPLETHPNGDNNGAVQWTIRRWAPQVEEVTPLALIWEIRKSNTNCGNGVTGSLHINGQRVDFLTIAGSDGEGETRTYFANVKPGDLIDLALSPLGMDGTNADGCDGSQSLLKVSRGVPAVPIQPDGTIFIPATADDSDGDGLPDPWEEVFFPGDLTKLMSGGDFDADGSLDEAELDRDTDPTNADSDGDTLMDGVETNTGEFVSASDTGTSPLKTDTDADGLADNVEMVSDPATDPTKADTDGDGFNDNVEIDAGHDPTDPADNPFVGVIAFSEDDWSRDGLQGENSWFYGYRNLTAEGDVEKIDYDPVADFIPYTDDWWNGATWDFPDGDVPWTTHSPNGTHPNGDNNNEVQWSVRRWEANVDDPTAIEIRWLTTKQNVSCGNGVTGAIHHNGVRIDSYLVPFDENDSEERIVYANVEPGDAIDLINSPYGEDADGNGTNADGCDGSVQHMIISTLIPDNPLQPDGSTFEPVVLGDPSLSFTRRSPFGDLGDTTGAVQRTVTLRNAGTTQDLTISGATLTGADADHFSYALDLPITLAPEESTELLVTFDPQGKDGGFVASLELVSNDENQASRVLSLNANIPDRNKLIAWYKFDETEGTTLNDSSGNGNNGTYLANGATLTLGEAGLAGGTALRLAPAGETAAYAEVPAFPVIEGGAFTISMWVQADDGLGAVAGLLSKNDGPDANGRPFAIASAEGRLNWFGEGVPDIAGGETSALISGQTQHVAVTYDPAGPLVTIFVDGQATESLDGASEIVDVRAALQIGAVNGAFGFSGLIDDLQIYGRTLSSDEVSELQANPGTKLGGDAEPDPEPNPDFPGVIAEVSKSGAQFRLSPGSATVTYQVEYSEDLTSWEVIGNDLTGDFEDTDATRLGKPAGYYRIRE